MGGRARPLAARFGTVTLPYSCAVPEAPKPDPQQFYDGALLRIRRFMLGLSGLGVLLCAWFFGWVGVLGFLVGAGISYINHRWLERMVDALGERITTGKSRERGGLLVLRALLRYVSIG